MVPFDRALVTSYRPSTVTFPLSIRVSEILPLLRSSTRLLPTPSVVSPKFPMFLWKLVDGLWAMKSEGVFQISNLCGPDQPTLHTDYGRTDDMQWQYHRYHALHYSASRGKD